ncbi:MAG TPA: neutral zinc metallopeptidase [Myxococcota bacterium]|nr:neutral zinc metallopeptidase [Myxococcota bacterium]
MRWTRGERSENLEDRRAEGGMGAGVGGLRIPGGLGLGGLVVMFGVAWLLGVDPLTLLGALSNSGTRVDVPGDTGSAQPGQPGAVSSSPAEEELVDFVSFVLDDTQATWSRLLPGYTDAQLVLFRNAVDTGCGFAQSAAGPFYCPRDHKVYVDLGFFEELRSRFGAPGDFAQAYVLAHEIGHHVQTQLGIERELRERQAANPREANALSVRLELQADCFAGVWGHSTARRDLLDPGDLDEGLAAAAAVGDDRIQEMATGEVRPESFTHGSSQQRTEWFRRGFESGDPKACDTFGNTD